jgi:hypothetical protein
MLVHKTNVLRLRNIPLLVICTLFIHEHIFTFKHLCLHSITKILRNGPRAHFPFIRPTSGLGLGLSPGRRRTPLCPTLGLGLGPGLNRRSPPLLTQGLGLDLGLGRHTRPRPRRSLHLAQPKARTDHVTGGAIITLPQADSGYGEQDRCPIWLAPPNK